MKPRNLLLVFALALSFSCAALAQDPDANVTTAARANPDRIQASGFPLRRTLDLRKNEIGCLKLRTYVVRRVSPDSDVTRLHSYTTCQPAWKFETRSAVQREPVRSEPPFVY